MKRFLINPKILITIFFLFGYRFGSEIPLSGIDQESLKKVLNTNGFFQLLNMYSNGGENSLSLFSLGIIPFINASIFLDLAATIFPPLEKLQSEEGETGKKKFFFYKKLLSFFLAIIQSIFFLNFFQAYFYDRSFFSFIFTVIELTTGSLIAIWLSTIIDNQGIGNGSSLIILVNILVTTLRSITTNFDIKKVESFGGELSLFFLLFILIINSQIARYSISIISARQLNLLEKNEVSLNQPKIFLEKISLIKENGVTLKYTQAGIFPLIIASNILPFFGEFPKFFQIFLYYILIIGFNYFYTTIFWDPEKISEQLRKASVSIIGKNPGKQTMEYLRAIAFYTSLSGGFYLCLILSIYEAIKTFFSDSLLIVNQINISSLIIAIGILCETVRNINSFLINEKANT